MTDDIVTRLRELAGYVRTDGNTWGEADCLEAADEIERLHKENQRLRQFADDLETAAEIDRVHLMSRIIAMEMAIPND